MEREGRSLANAHPVPRLVALRIGELLREACERQGLDRFAFLQVGQQLALLIDHVGGCDRALSAPLPQIYSITVRGFVLLFLLQLPLALLHRLGAAWLIPLVTMLAAYPPAVARIDRGRVGGPVHAGKPGAPAARGHLGGDRA